MNHFPLIKTHIHIQHTHIHTTLNGNGLPSFYHAIHLFLSANALKLHIYTLYPIRSLVSTLYIALHGIYWVLCCWCRYCFLHFFFQCVKSAIIIIMLLSCLLLLSLFYAFFSIAFSSFSMYFIFILSCTLCT